MVRRFLKFATLAIGIAWFVPSASAQASPSATVERLNTTLLQVMQQAGTLGYEGRYNTLAPVLTETFNFPVMARISVGKHWDSMSQEQKQEFVNIFARLSVATFASRFDGYGGEYFKITGEADQRKNTVLVSNQLVKQSGETVSLNYIVRQFDNTWRIIDVFLDAKYSELALKRSEYSSVVEREGYASLIASMEEKIAFYARGKTGS